MDICTYIVPSQHGGTLNSRRVASPLVRGRRVVVLTTSWLALSSRGFITWRLKNHRAEELKNVEYVVSQSPPVFFGNQGKRCHLKCHPRHLIVVQNYKD
ncbi:hypothetical protein TNCV_3274511 [Trichonephila clavipes]|nr:hypothetical protein TNCV_3274511 [Trichonephila clavipes]